MKNIDNFDLSGKKVLVRVGFNVPIADGDTKQKFRIAAACETVDALLDAGARVALLSHLGRPDGPSEELSFAQLIDDVSEILNRPVVFAEDCVGESVVAALSGAAEQSVVLLENVRFHPEETAEDPSVRLNFAEKLAEPFDFFVNDAFSVSHRNHASVTGLAQVLPAVAGKRLEKEVEILSRVRSFPEKPATLLVGGAKIATKLPLIEALQETYDHILLGGKVANEALAENLEFPDKVVLPRDFAAGRFDIGPETIENYRRTIIRSATVLWNGPMGKYEEEKFAAGTYGIVKALSETKAFTVVGGGESVEALEHAGVLEKIDFVSTGGGAMLDFVSGRKLPGVEILL